MNAGRQLGFIIVALLVASCGSDHVSFAELPLPAGTTYGDCSPFTLAAVEERDLALIRNFKEHGGIGNCKDTQRAVYHSMQKDDIDWLVAVLAAGVDPETPLLSEGGWNFDGCWPPLAYAFEKRNGYGEERQRPPRRDATVLKLLLDAGANPNNDWGAIYCSLPSLPKGARYTPLNVAAISGDVEFAKLLLDAGAHVMAVDSEGRTALDIAAHGNRPDNREAMTALLRRAMVTQRR